MAKVNLIIIATVALILMLVALATSTDEGKECTFEKHNGKHVARGCKKCKDYEHQDKCAKTPGCSMGPDSCLPILKQYCPATCEINLGVLLPPLKHIVCNLTLDSICLDIFWNDMGCKHARPTNILIYLKKCILKIVLQHISSAVNCCTLSLCRLCPIKDILQQDRDKSKSDHESSKSKSSRSKHDDSSHS